MQIPTSAGMLANSVLPVTPTQGGLLSQVGETAGSASFAPVEAVSSVSLSGAVPQQRAQPATAPENTGRPDISSVRGRDSSTNETGENDSAVGQPAEQDGSAPIQAQPNENAQRSDNESKQQARNQEQQQQQDLELVRSLSQRDSEVHAHENAHSAVGGQYAGSANYTYQRGPDGINYAVGGEVSIDVGVISGNPRATLEKMQLVQRAALAPAEPSSQDRRVAALASQQANQARAEIVIESRVTNGGASSDTKSSEEKKDAQTRPELATDASNIRVSAPVSSETDNFQVFNNRIAKINEILLAVSRNDVASATGQLLDDVV